MRERLELIGPWFQHPVTKKFVDWKDLPQDYKDKLNEQAGKEDCPGNPGGRD